jgi:hypothetical protein
MVLSRYRLWRADADTVVPSAVGGASRKSSPSRNRAFPEICHAAIG